VLRQIYVIYVRCVTEKFVKKLWRKRKDKIQAALERLDRLTRDEGLSVAAHTLGVIHGIANDGAVMGGAPYYFRDFSQIFVYICSIRWKGTDG